ncbi:ATP-dependent Clp protease ATP-binding subunit ClpX [Bacillus sp. M6-12]|uniref:ATP-dependent Clp protease ATP-binding subunit ClpX n=1 Tax=Bacillus sp. M6-12 TaxID=2054166 RepID=UPI000C76937D|nr:ATP-dependent Clp protease ATP-binding subunit ClpX [Bacillus sp. M6-12]PLS19678.1 ATP-dependent Clp protease ATP-binding subunit ClpX [Bacillus sp. M6-12]
MSKQCSFCGTTEDTNVVLLEGAEANICKDCAVSSLEAFEEMVETQITQSNTFLKPHQIKEELDKYIVGQDDAKKILSVAVYNHYKRIHSNSKVDIQKTNIMLIGPTGSGKTYLMQILAKVLNVPLAIVDSTSLTEAGYVGEDVESILEKLIQKADGDIKRAEKGIIYIDEIDKIANKSIEGRKNTRDISGEGVQQALLKIVEDSEVYVNVGGSPTTKRKVLLNTKNILFVCGGAFVGINDIVKKRLEPKKTSSIGFSLPTESKAEEKVDYDKDVTQQDVIEFGFIPEFVGRVPVVAILKPLSKEDLANILVKPKNSVIKQYQALFRMDGVRLKFHQSAIDYIVEEAERKKVGARGLKGVIEKRMYDIMFELPKQSDVKSYTITKDVLLNK